MELILPTASPPAGSEFLLGFAFGEDEAPQPVRIVVRQGRRVIARFNCPDPPCYEFQVPTDQLRLRVAVSVEIFSYPRLRRSRHLKTLKIPPSFLSASGLK